MVSACPPARRPAYQQIADELRRRVQTGALGPGSKLPTEVELMGEFDVSRVVARLAVGVLRTEGLIYSRLRMMRFKGWVRSNLACRLSLDNVPRWCQRGW